MQFWREEVVERLQTLRQSGVGLWAVITPLISAILFYDGFISQFLPESIRSRLPKAYEIMHTIMSSLSFTSWLTILAGFFCLGIIEHVHRKRIKKESITPILILGLTSIVVALLAFQQNLKSDKPVVEPSNALVAQIESQEKSVLRLESMMKMEQEKVARLTDKIASHLNYLSNKSKIVKLVESSDSIKSDLDAIYNFNCSDLSTNKNLTPTYYAYRSRQSFNLETSIITGLRRDIGISSIVPDNLQILRQNFLNALGRHTEDAAQNADYIYARGKYKDSCEALKANTISFTGKIDIYKGELANKIRSYEETNGLL